VLYFGVAFDGLQLGKNYTVNMYVMRCRDAPPDIAVQSGTVVPLLIIPGPRDPEGGFDAYTSLVMHLFHAYGPRSGEFPTHTRVCTHRCIAMHAVYVYLGLVTKSTT
jgi:hypothetical protein